LSSDLESASRIPDHQSFLLAESGERNDQGQQFRRLFLAEFREQADGKLELFSGTDDENYGAALRLIPLQP